MLQSQAENCYRRTQTTQAEYEAKRNELKHSKEQQKEKPHDPRYDQWIP
jgi:hypothetical protein